MENGVESFFLGCCKDECIQAAVVSVDVVCKVDGWSGWEHFRWSLCMRQTWSFYMSKVCDFQFSMCVSLDGYLHHWQASGGFVVEVLTGMFQSLGGLDTKVVGNCRPVDGAQLRLLVVMVITRRQTQVLRSGLSILSKFLASSGVLYLKQTSCIPERTRVYCSWRTSTIETLSISLLQHCFKASVAGNKLGLCYNGSWVIGFSSPGCKPWQQVASEYWCGFSPGRIEETTGLCILVCAFVMWARRSLDSEIWVEPWGSDLKIVRMTRDLSLGV